MGACGFVSELDRKKQEIIQIACELEDMKELPLFTRLILDYDLLAFYSNESDFQEKMEAFLKKLTQTQA